MIDWIRLWWHSLLRVASKEDHRMCSLYLGSRRHYFCACGYLNEGVSMAQLQKNIADSGIQVFLVKRPESEE